MAKPDDLLNPEKDPAKAAYLLLTEVAKTGAFNSTSHPEKVAGRLIEAYKELKKHFESYDDY